MYVLYIVACPFVLFFAIVLSVLFRLMDSDYPFVSLNSSYNHCKHYETYEMTIITKSDLPKRSYKNVDIIQHLI